MARRTKTVVIQGDPEKNRDAGKVFKLTEMPASQIESWAIEVYQGLASSGIALPENAAGAGMAGLARLSFQAIASVPYGQLHDLLNRLMACVKIARDKTHPDVAQDLIEEDIEEVSTRLLLKAEVFELHTGFSLADLKSKLTSGSAPTT